MTKQEYRQAFRLTDREKADIWQEVRSPQHRRRSRPHRWLPALGGAAALACLAAVVLFLNESPTGRGPVPAPQVAAVHPSGEQRATPPAANSRAAESQASAPQRQTPPVEAAAPIAKTAPPLDIGETFVAYDSAAGSITLDNPTGGAASATEGRRTGERLAAATPEQPSTAEAGAVMRSHQLYMRGDRPEDVRTRIDAATVHDPASSERPSTSAPPTAGAESGGARNPNDRPYDLVYHRHHGVNPFVTTAEDALSTFAVEVDDASWTIARRYLADGHLPPPEAIRLEEIVNRIDAGFAPGDDDFSLHADGMPSRFGAGYHLLRLGVRARDVATAERLPALLVFVIDVSGSMDRENRLGLVKKALRVLVDELRPGDRVGIVTFGSDARVALEPTGAEERSRILAFVDELRPGGSTNAEAGLRLAYELARRHAEAGAIQRLILCSDGVANLGHTGAETILAAVRGEADRGITLTAVGFGMGNYNDMLMEQLANRGDGTYHYVDRIADAERVFRQNLTGTLQTVGREVKTQVEFDPATVVRWRLLGYENRHLDDRDFRNDAVDAGEIGVGHAAVALYEVKLSDEATRAAARGRSLDLGVVRLRWTKPRFHPDSGAVAERERLLTTSDLVADWTAAAPRLRAAALAAEFAEILRESYWARGSALGDLLAPASELVRELPDDADIIELAQMIRRAADLQARQDAAAE